MPNRADPATAAAIASARQGGLRYVSDEEPGLSRRRTASGFRFTC